MLEDFKAMFNHHTATLKDEIKSLRLENDDLRQKLDDLEQYGRRPLVRFSGIPEIGKDEDTTSLVLDVASKANLDLSPDNINLSHRVGPFDRNNKKPRQIIMRLKTHNAKKRLLKSRSKISVMQRRARVYR